ncbi:MAG: ATP synthase F1 subunit epsilon [Alphaproteobacteria bacterium]|nr:ATP synthase F1 subunit epsilon [Alphaproteobacteria bacterium]
MADKVSFELVSPAKLLLSEDVEMVVVPGAEGDFGVLAGHAPVISTVRPGTITVYQDDGVSERIFVAGGIAEVTMERCTVLAEEAERVDDIDRAEVEGQMAELRDLAGVVETDTERGSVQTRMAVAEAKLAALDEAIYQ